MTPSEAPIGFDEVLVKAGQPIRFPPETKGRFEPVEENQWLGEHTINVPDRRAVDDTGAGRALKQE